MITEINGLYFCSDPTENAFSHFVCICGTSGRKMNELLDHGWDIKNDVTQQVNIAVCRLQREIETCLISVYTHKMIIYGFDTEQCNTIRGITLFDE